MKGEKKKQYTTDGVRILHDLFVRNDQEMVDLLKKERVKADIAQKIYDMRIAEGLTQKQLADRIGTTPSVISRLEDSDYDGHSLKMMNRIAEALNYQLDITFRKGFEKEKTIQFNWELSISDSIKWRMNNEECFSTA